MKEPSTLPDIQYSRDTRAIELQDVGVSDFLTRILVRDENGVEVAVPARCSLSASLEENLKGSHLSRFVEAAEFLQQHSLNNQALNDFLDLLLEKLQSQTAAANFTFDYLFSKAAPISGKTALTGCSVSLEAEKHSGQSANCALKLTVPVSTTCPCSKAISEEGAHNQRANISVSLFISPGSELPEIAALYQSLESCGSAPVYPLLKRPDEKFITETQYRNPKFVEDVAREVILTLRQRTDLIGYSLFVESLESIHSHNAFVAHSEFFDQ